MGQISPYITQAFNGLIWRLEIDALSDTLFCEIRNEADKLATFASIDLSTPRVNFDKLTTNERWLTGIEAAYNGVLLLHHYEGGNTPVHKGLIAVDAATGTTLWANYNCAFDHLATTGPVVFDTRIQPRKLVTLSVITGELQHSFNPSVDYPVSNNIGVPDILPASSVKSSSVLPQPVPQSVVHYMEHNGLKIVSLHTLFAGGLEQYLYILKGDEMVYRELLNTGIQKLQPEAFVMHNNYLIYIKNRSEIKVINL